MDRDIIEYGKGKGRKLVEPDDTRLKRKRLAVAQIPPARMKARWDYMPDDAPHKKLLLNYASDLQKALDNGTGLLLSGKTRKGKTSAAVLICKEVIRRDGYPFFVEARKLTQIVIGKEDDGEINRKLRYMSFLVIDDIGDTQVTNFKRDVLEDILRDRENRELPTILTTNCSGDQLEEAYGEPCIGLINETCLPIIFGDDK